MWIPALSFFSVFLLVVGVYFLVKDIKNLIAEKKLKRRLDYRNVRGRIGRTPVGMSNIRAFILKISEKDAFKKLEFLLQRAGFLMSWHVFLFFCLCSGMIFWGAAYGITRLPFLAIFSGGIGSLMPVVFLFLKLGIRAREIQKKLPDMIGFIARALRAGQSLEQSLSEVGRQDSGPLGQVMKRMSAERNLGMSFETAVRNLRNRMPNLVEVKMFCTALVVQKSVGGNLAEILETISGILRDRLAFLMKIKVISAEGRVSSMILIALPFIFGCLVYFINADYISVLFTHPGGHCILFVAVFLQVLGFLVIRWITRLEI